MGDAMIARGLGATQPEVPLLPGGHYCWGVEKGRSHKAASSSRAAQGSDKKGMGPRKALQPQEAVIPAIETAVSGEVWPTCLPSRPAGLSEVRLARTPGKTRTRGGDIVISNLASKQSKFKENLDLYSSCCPWPTPTQGWPNKKLGRARAWPPSGQCTELRKVSLQDTRENGRHKALLFSDPSSTGHTCPGPCPQTCCSSSILQADFWQGRPFPGRPVSREESPKGVPEGT